MGDELFFLFFLTYFLVISSYEKFFCCFSHTFLKKIFFLIFLLKLIFKGLKHLFLFSFSKIFTKNFFYFCLKIFFKFFSSLISQHFVSLIHTSKSFCFSFNFYFFYYFFSSIKKYMSQNIYIYRYIPNLFKKIFFLFKYFLNTP